MTQLEKIVNETITVEKKWGNFKYKNRRFESKKNMREHNTEDEQKYNVMIGGILRKN